MDVRIDTYDPACVSLLDMLTDGLERRTFPALETDLHDPAALFHSIDHGTAFADIVAQRFLAIDIQPAVQRANNLERMPVGRRGNDDGFETGHLEQVVIHFECL